jgi:hypothetical protein
VLMPAVDRQLTGDDCGAVAIPVVEDLEQVLALRVCERDEAPIVDLCGAPHNSNNATPAVMWSEAAFTGVKMNVIRTTTPHY